MSDYKIKIHLILPGGGVRGSFQGGFLYILMKYFSECFEFIRIDSASAGALNGSGLCLKLYDELNNFWLNFTSINDIFAPYSSIPLIGTLVNAYTGYYNMGLSSNIKLDKYIDEFFKKSELNKKELDKLNVVVTNLNTSRYEYINGTNVEFKSFLKASASPWILTCPTIINGISYTDGSLLQQFPIKNIGKIKCDKVLVIGVDDKYFNHMYSEIGSNLFGYINKILDVLYLQCNLEDYLKIKEYEHDNNNKVYIAKYNLEFSPLDFSQNNINEGLKQGKNNAIRFILDNVDLKKYYSVSEYLDIEI